MSDPQKPTKQERQTRKRIILDEVDYARRSAGQIQLREKSDIEKEEIKNEILDALEKESLKREILDELSKPKSKLPELFKHPAIIVLITFILTSILGTLLSLTWQSREWNRQQTLQSQEWNRQQIRLVQIREIEQKYKVVEEVSSAVTTYDSAARDALITLTWPINDRRRTEEAPERIKQWQQANKEWRANTQKLFQKLLIHFKEPAVQRSFENIIENRSDINEQIVLLQAEIKANGNIVEDEAFKRRVYETLDNIDRRIDDSRRLIEGMIAEIRAGVELHE